MPDFAYTARTLQGQRVTGTVTAGSLREASAQLASKSLLPVEVKQASRQAAVSLGSNRRIKGQVMATTYGQMAGLLRSGVPLLRTLTVLGEQSTNPALAEVLQDVRGRVEEGEPLGAAMARHPKAFSEMAINMVRAGTEGGFLEDALERVAQFTELQEDLKGRTISALAYPVFLMCAGTVIVTGLIVFFVPKFERLFTTLRQRAEMPAITEYLLAFSSFLQSYGWMLILALVGLFFLVRMQLQTDRGRMLWDRFKIRVPMFGPILLNLAVARFCRVLGTLLANGVSILKALEISRDAAGNRVLGLAVSEAAEQVQAGQKLAEPLARSGHFPMTVIEMIRVAEEANSLDTVLPQISDGLEKRTFRRLDLLVRLLEPVLLLIMAAVVLCVVLALLLPIIKANSAL
jgi:general secretion pathway protein F/type IV pilus assembly protein PilC